MSSKLQQVLHLSGHLSEKRETSGIPLTDKQTIDAFIAVALDILLPGTCFLSSQY